MEAVLGKLGLETLGAAFARTLRVHRWPLGLVAAYVALAQLFAAAMGLGDRVRLNLYDKTLLVLLGTAAVVFLTGYVFYVMAWIRPERLTRFLREDFAARFCQPERLFGLALVIAFTPPLLSTVSTLKTAIPAVQDFPWDPTFAEWDRLLHGGTHPWQWLQPLIGHPFATYVVNVSYNIWFFFIYAMLLWQAARHSLSAQRLQFLIAFVLCWTLLASLAALVFASAGPVYYGRVTGLPDPYAPLMDYLYQSNDVLKVWALNAQELLWTAYSSDYQIPGGGISAMPSMHLAMAWLLALTVRQRSRRLGWACMAYAALIEIGSIHLGWHYAIDGYAAILATTLIWWVAGIVARRELPDSAFEEGKAS